MKKKLTPELDLNSCAYNGPLGSLIKEISPEYAMSDSNLLVQTLVSIGHVVGRTFYTKQHSIKYYPNIFACLIGRSGTGKGVSAHYASTLTKLLYNVEKSPCIEVTGISSGPGIINAFHQLYTEEVKMNEEEVTKKSTNKKANYKVIENPEDNFIGRKLLFVESEFGRVLRIIRKAEDTTRHTIIDMWDNKDLQNISKGNPQKVISPHGSIITHITPNDLKREISRDQTILTNGFLSRFLFFHSKPKQKIFNALTLEEMCLNQGIINKIRENLKKGTGSLMKLSKEIPLSDDASKYYEPIFLEENEFDCDIKDSFYTRRDSHVLKFALIYAILDRSNVITEAHLKSSYAIWKYNMDTTEFYMSNETEILSKRSQKLLRVLQEKNTMTRSEITKTLFKGNLSPNDIENLKEDLKNWVKIENNENSMAEIWSLCESK